MKLYRGIETAFIASVHKVGREVRFATSVLDFLLRGGPIDATDVESVVDRVLRVPAGPGRVAVQNRWFALSFGLGSGAHLATEGSDEVDVVATIAISGSEGAGMSSSDGE